MNRVFIVVILVVAGVVGLGFYRGWFNIGSNKADGKSNLTLSMDTNKIQEDKTSALAKVEGVEHNIQHKIAGSADKTSMDGKVVSISADKLTMTNKDGNEHSHDLAANVKVTCDGKTCTAADLKAGMRIRVTTGSGDSHTATRIEALEHNADFEKGA